MCRISVLSHNTQTICLLSSLDRLFITSFCQDRPRHVCCFKSLRWHHSIGMRITLVGDIYLFSINHHLKSPFGPSVNQIKHTHTHKKTHAVKNGTRRFCCCCFFFFPPRFQDYLLSSILHYHLKFTVVQIYDRSSPWMEMNHSFILISRRGRGIHTMSPQCDKLRMHMTHTHLDMEGRRRAFDSLFLFFELVGRKFHYKKCNFIFFLVHFISIRIFPFNSTIQNMRISFLLSHS